MSLTPSRKPPPGQRRYRHRGDTRPTFGQDSVVSLLLMLTCLPRRRSGRQSHSDPSTYLGPVRTPEDSPVARTYPSTPR